MEKKTDSERLIRETLKKKKRKKNKIRNYQNEEDFKKEESGKFRFSNFTVNFQKFKTQVQHHRKKSWNPSPRHRLKSMNSGIKPNIYVEDSKNINKLTVKKIFLDEGIKNFKHKLICFRILNRNQLS